MKLPHKENPYFTYTPGNQLKRFGGTSKNHETFMGPLRTRAYRGIGSKEWALLQSDTKIMYWVFHCKW